MLVLSPESSCDVCAESYSVDSCPHSIPCGHTFCASCLTKIAQGLWSPRTTPVCPLCREGFTAADIRLIRIDAASAQPGYPHVFPYPNYYPSGAASSSSSSAATGFGAAPIDEDALDGADQRVNAEAKRLEDKISAAAKKKCTFEELSALQREVEQWLAKELARRPDREHASLRLSAALLGAILINGFAYNEAKKHAKGVEVSLMDKLEQAEVVKRKLEFELHRQRAQYSQKLLELQQLKHEVSRLSAGSSPLSSPPTSARALPLGSALMATPPRAMSVQPARVSTPGTPTRASTPGSAYAAYSHFPKRSMSTTQETTSHLPISTSYLSATTSHLPVPSNSRSLGASPERPTASTQHQRWIPPAASRDDADAEREAHARGRPRPASAAGLYAHHGAGSMSRPRTSAGWRP
ncbi:hypothetical protein EXIGLDRAFT_839035 [Exidia glandulosa HHB12029]|uniref:RING-type domain-containing protein n=1 Tax=Exidia glandulosa HHB12029 TaxID=1314781 RepID=A0A165FB81_EXIGL|nr:hypothetical protein EXIGLDRAFT_839035 [Exidia glandulosa HHB12029]